VLLKANKEMDAKRIAGEKAVELVQDGMTVGLGTGSTSYWAIQKIGQRIKEGLKVRAVASSKQSEAIANELNIPIIPFSEVDTIDLYIDGADEVDKNQNLIKGGGGALLREKILASFSKKFIVIVDPSKLVEMLGKFPLPVEIVPFASELTIKRIQKLGCTTQIRQKEGVQFVSDNGNIILDCNFGTIPDPAELNLKLHMIPGVVETGIFVNTLVNTVIVGNN
jgi:ribose 5-phosphate isomerase A